MRTPWEVIAEIESDNSRLVKEAIVLKEAEAGNTEFFDGCRMAMDCMVTFGLKQIKEKTDEDGPGIDWDSFSSISERLRNRDLTGNDARDAVTALMAQATKAQWNGWYRRILIKDMRAGFSESTVNKVTEKKYAHYSVPVFSCQLANDSANHETKVAGSKIIEVKLDGVRVITIVYPNGRVDQFSRNGKELVNFPHVKEQIAKIAHSFTEPMVLDGEIMSGSFQDLMKQIHRKSSAKANDAVLNLFDAVPLAQFETGESVVTQEKRSEWLKTWFDANEPVLPNVTVVAQELVNLETPEGQVRYKEINAMAIAGGYEGIMLKDPKAGYKCKRSVAWLKLKPFIEVSLTVSAVEEGTGKNVGKLGALVCEGTDDGKDIVVNVGSGFSDDQRVVYWILKE
jgi:DNA ligase-1